MAKNPGGSSGSSVRFVAAGNYVSGQWLKVGQYFGQVQADVATGDVGILQLEDIVYGAIAAVDCAIGDPLFYDADAGDLTNVIGDGSKPFVGVAAEVIASATGAGLVRLNESGIDPVIAAMVADTAKQARGVQEFGAADTAKTISVGTAFNEKPVMCTFGQVDCGAAAVISAVVAAGTLTITLDAAPGSGKTALVNWYADAR